MKEALRQRARELGFDDCRVTTADAPESAAQFNNGWPKVATEKWRSWSATRAKRIDPQQVLPGARSIITLAASYHDRAIGARMRGPSPMSTAGPWHRPLRSLGDYHNILGERLKQLAEFVNDLGGAGTRSLWYVDTGPLLERDLAQRAGLGFIGKHTNLISRQLGNWIFLSEIITTLDLEPDAPEKNRCGSCTRCIAACPTEAITAPFQLDARRCISYLTIELQGIIPPELRPRSATASSAAMIVLLACPWNRFAREGQMMKAHARPELAQPDLLELLALDEAGFKRRFADTPMLRTRRRGLRRNVCVALGNTGDEGPCRRCRMGRVIPSLWCRSTLDGPSSRLKRN